MPAKKTVLLLIIFLLFVSCSHMPSENDNTKTVSKILQSDPGKTSPKDLSSPSKPDPGTFSDDASLEGTGTGEDDLVEQAMTDHTLDLANHPQDPDNAGQSAETTETEPKHEQSNLDEALDFCEVAQSYWQKGELEHALEALDKAYSLILVVDSNDDAKLTQQKDDLRYTISKRILEIYASRNIVVNGNHNEIPLEMNRHVEAELKRFTNGEKQFFFEAYQRSGLYRNSIVSALKKAGLPEELSWLPLIESGFKVKALSRARALGLWQFIPSTGYKFGLKRNNFIDERIDFIKATDAAIAYLKELHSIFGDWATVLAAYNCGEGRVLQVIRGQNINYLDNFWDLYERLPLETARYVPRFFATLHMVKNPEKYGLDKVKREPALAFDELEIQRQVNLNSIGKATGIDLSALKTLNPELRYQILPPEPYKLRIPVGHADLAIAKIETIPTAKLPHRVYAYHRVRSGETLSTIARRYRTSVAKIMRANNLRRSHFIRTGQKLKIPQRGYTVARAVVDRTPKKIPASGTHYVRKGDSLWNIAKRYGTTVKKIRTLNGLSSNYLSIGQPLKIPGFKTEPLPDTSELDTYRVKRGDSPFNIAQEHNMTLKRLLLLNKLHPLSKIYPGQKLYIE